MLRRAVKSMRNNESFDLDAPFQAMAEINLHAPALLPADYVEDVHQRLSFYKELASCESFNAIETVREALGDRYGKLPPQANTLIERTDCAFIVRTLVLNASRQQSRS